MVVDAAPPVNAPKVKVLGAVPVSLDAAFGWDVVRLNGEAGMSIVICVPEAPATEAELTPRLDALLPATVEPELIVLEASESTGAASAGPSSATRSASNDVADIRDALKP